MTMACFAKPKNLRQAVIPMIYLNWLVGISVTVPTSSVRCIVTTTIYTLTLWAFLLYTFYIGIASMMEFFTRETSPLAVLMYTALIYTNAICAMAVPILALMRKKELKDCFESLERLEEPYYQASGEERDYWKILKPQLYTIATICALIVAITAIDSLWGGEDESILLIITMMITLHHPMLLLLVTDLTFCTLIRYIGERIFHLNAALLTLADNEPRTEPRPGISQFRKRITIISPNEQKSSPINAGFANNIAANMISKRRRFKAIRKIHFEITKVAAKFNHTYGVQNLLSMGLSFVMITGLLYGIYVAFHFQTSFALLMQEIIPPVGWCAVYVYKIFMISHTCASVKNEAYKSGQIIYDILGTTSDRELQKEVQEFSLQLIQNPVQFTACGFFALDHTYIQGAIGSITTYLVILIQMSDASRGSKGSAPAVSDNKTSP